MKTNRVPVARPAVSPHVARLLLGYRGPTADQPPDPEAIAGLAPRSYPEARWGGWVVANLSAPTLGPDGHNSRN